MPRAIVLLLLVLGLVAVAPAAAAKGILEDQATYPAGVTSVTRTWVAPGEDFSVVVDTDGSVEQAAMAICRFPGEPTHAPATGSEYYKVVVAPPTIEPQQYGGGDGAATKASPGFCMPCFLGIALAVLIRRRAL
ncbi:MAG: hypothetical protein LC620_02485 [Halobacteriales archaeon]|nr:hypothetical protein [Halobacteriales archaeon]